MSGHLPLILVVSPLFASFLVFSLGWWNRRIAYPLAMAGLTVCMVAAPALAKAVFHEGSISYRLGGWPPPIGIELRVDALSAFMLVLIAALGWTIGIYSRRSVEKELPDRIWLFWSLYLLQMTGLFGIIVSGDLFNLFVLLEVASLTGYALVGMGGKPAAFASFRYLILGTVGASFYLLGVGYLYIKTGSLNMEDLRGLLPVLYESRVVQASFVFMVIGFCIKIALFPLHAWQPNAYTHAPSAVSVLISTAGAKTFTYALLRVVFSVFTVDFVRTVLPVFEILCWTAAVAMVAGSVFAIAQNDLKRMLAYSSVANVGYIVLALGLSPMAPSGLTPVVVHIANHALIKGCMFMAVCAFFYRFGTTDLRCFEGVGRQMPYSSLALILAALAMIGLPPGAGFVTKWYLILAAVETGRYVFVAAVFISTLLMITYFLRVVEIIYVRTGAKSAPAGSGTSAEAPLSMTAPTLALGILTFLAGIAWISGLLHPMLSAINAGFRLGGGP